MSQFKVLFISNLILFAATQYSNIQCDCSQILNQNDCQLMNTTCEWESKSGLCTDQVIVVQEQQQTSVSSSLYCKQFNSQIDCVNQNNYPCLWFNNKCSHFTGCSAFMEKTDEKCQEISKQCISNGENCIQIGYCFTYHQKSACKISITGDYCYWENDLQSCKDAYQCEEFPTIFTTDQQCRLLKYDCTVKQGGGCQKSGQNCSDQLLEIQCYLDYYRSQDCFWYENLCYDKTCSKAPIAYQTDKECFDFLPECSIKETGGCEQRMPCSSIKYQPACTQDHSDPPCLWKNESCKYISCDDAPEKTETDDQCEKYGIRCSLKAEGGCIDFFDCEDIIDQPRCNKAKDLNQRQCIWSSSCNRITCNTAPITYTPTQCSTFSDEPQCQPSENGGCHLPKECKDFDNQGDCDEANIHCLWSDEQCKTASQICYNIV